MRRFRGESECDTPPDLRRRAYFDHYASDIEIARMVDYGKYVQLREAGNWNRWCDEFMGGRFKVED